jgi:WhiB family redox-sensing transcriptional regulator
VPNARIADKTANGHMWRQRAACRDMDADLFFPVGSTGPALARAERAIGVCRTCPVAPSCLEWALAIGEVGVWGGTTDDERKTLKRRRQRAAQRAAADTPA